VNNRAVELFGKGKELRAQLEKKQKTLYRLTKEVEKLERNIEVADFIDEVWDGVPVHCWGCGEFSVVGDNSMYGGRKIKIYCDARTGRDGIPPAFHFRIYDKQKNGEQRWGGGKTYMLGLKTMKEALVIAREWIVKGTIQGEAPED